MANPDGSVIRILLSPSNVTVNKSREIAALNPAEVGGGGEGGGEKREVSRASRLQDFARSFVPRCFLSRHTRRTERRKNYS